MPRPKKAIRCTRRPETGLYSVSFAEAPGWHATGQGNEADALRWARAMKGELLERKVVRFRDVAAGFYDDGSPWVRLMTKQGRTLTQEYLTQMRGRLSGYLLPEFGDVPLTQITRKVFGDWLLFLDRGVRGGPIKNSTKNKVFDCMWYILDYQVRERLLPSHPLEGMTHLIPSDERPREIFSDEELAALFPEDRADLERIWADPAKRGREYGPLWLSFMLALRDTGARPAELLAQTWGKFDSEACGFPIHEAVQNTTGAIKSRTKTGTNKPAFLSPRAIQELMIWCSASEHTLPTDLIWSLDGRLPVRTESAAKHFKAVCKRAGVDRRGRTPYCLRHTFATRAITTMDYRSVQILMGHSAKSMTALQSYFHPTDAMIMRMGEGLRDVLFPKE